DLGNPESSELDLDVAGFREQFDGRSLLDQVVPAAPDAGGRKVSFAEKLKTPRKQAGLTQQGLADASCRGLGTIRDYEQGKREPLLSTAFQLARALGVSVEVFDDGAAAAAAKRKKSK